MKVKVSNLSGAALDWAVAKCEGKNIIQVIERTTYVPQYPKIGGVPYTPSTDWTQGGPIIERERICVSPFHESTKWSALDSKDRRYGAKGETALVAAMCCYVASKLGDEIEVPEELK